MHVLFGDAPTFRPNGSLLSAWTSEHLQPFDRADPIRPWRLHITATIRTIGSNLNNILPILMLTSRRSISSRYMAQAFPYQMPTQQNQQSFSSIRLATQAHSASIKANFSASTQDIIPSARTLRADTHVDSSNNSNEYQLALPKTPKISHIARQGILPLLY